MLVFVLAKTNAVSSSAPKPSYTKTVYSAHPVGVSVSSQLSVQAVLTFPSSPPPLSLPSQAPNPRARAIIMKYFMVCS